MPTLLLLLNSTLTVAVLGGIGHLLISWGRASERIENLLRVYHETRARLTEIENIALETRERVTRLEAVAHGGKS